MPDKNDKNYRTLDLEPGASKEEVKKAFRELSHIWHPDNHMGKPKNLQNKANEKFKEISEAYQLINEFFDKENSSSKKDNYENESAEQRREEEEKQKKRAPFLLYLSRWKLKEIIQTYHPELIGL